MNGLVTKTESCTFWKQQKKTTRERKFHDFFAWKYFFRILGIKEVKSLKKKILQIFSQLAENLKKNHDCNFVANLIWRDVSNKNIRRNFGM